MKQTSLLFLFAAFLISFGAQATSLRPTRYVCSNVGGTEEWTIYVDLTKKLAGFFDNDNTAVIRLKTVKSLETIPPQWLYLFEGKDTGGGSRETLRIAFNATKLTGSVTFNPNTRKARTLKAEDGCHADNRIDLP